MIFILFLNITWNISGLYDPVLLDFFFIICLRMLGRINWSCVGYECYIYMSEILWLMIINGKVVTVLHNTIDDFLSSALKYWFISNDKRPCQRSHMVSLIEVFLHLGAMGPKLIFWLIFYWLSSLLFSSYFNSNSI